MLRPNSLACDTTSMGLLLMVIGSKSRLVLAKLMRSSGPSLGFVTDVFYFLC